MGDNIKYIIKKYIEKITLQDIICFAEKNNIAMEKKEAIILQNYIKKNWEEIIYGDYTNTIQTLKNQIEKNTIEKIEKLFLMYKAKYKNYL